MGAARPPKLVARYRPSALVGFLAVFPLLCTSQGCTCPEDPGAATCDGRRALDTEGQLEQVCSDLKGQADLCTLGGVPVSTTISIPGAGALGECQGDAQILPT